MAHELIAAADTQNDAPVFDDGPKVRAFRPREVLDKQGLLAVLPPTEEEDVAAGRPYALSEPHIHHFYGYTAPLRTLLYGYDVPAVAIEVHYVGVEVVNGQRHPSQDITPSFSFFASLARCPSRSFTRSEL